MFGIGETELVIIVVFAFLLFGPDKLPGMGRTLGRVLRQFREASDGFTEVVQTNIMDPAAEELQKSPKQRAREKAETKGVDTDVEVSEGTEAAEPAKRETFAERKARLAAEREKREAEAAAAAQSVVYDDEDADIDEDEEDLEFFDDDVDSDEDVDQEAPKRTTAADLYQMGNTRSSRFRATEAAKEAEDSVAAAEPKIAGPVLPVTEDAPQREATIENGEGEGDSRA